jgi:hypothetical protein
VKYFLKEFTEPIAYLIYCIALFATYKVRKNRSYKLLAFYDAIASLLLFAAIVQNELEIDNDWNYNVVFLLAICVYSYYYHSLLKSLYKRRFILFCCIANIILFLYFNVINGKFAGNYNNYVYAIVFISIVVYTFLYFQDLLLNVSEESILHKFDFWLVSSNLLYFLGAFIVILYYAYAEDSMRGSVWIIQSLVLFISALITLNGYFVTARKTK